MFFLAPALVFIVYALYIPFVWNGILSFQQWNGFRAPQWAGLQNYRQFFTDPIALKSLGNSIFLALVSTAGSIALGLFLAMMLYKVKRKEGAFYRLVIFLPVMLPTAIVGLLFTFVFNYSMGLLNGVLRLLGMGGLAKAWLENKGTVMWCIAIVNIWKMSGLTMMLSFAAMQMLPDSIFESSKLDGATYSRQFFQLILPLIKPTVLLAAVYSLAVNFKSYDIVFVMTGGGPGTTSYVIPINMVKTAFSFGEFGYSAAMGIVLTVAVFLIVSAVRKVLGGETYEY
jgi:raffinose/stachyose/melibiose transport system permease protein